MNGFIVGDLSRGLGISKGCEGSCTGAGPPRHGRRQRTSRRAEGLIRAVHGVRGNGAIGFVGEGLQNSWCGRRALSRWQEEQETEGRTLGLIYGMKRKEGRGACSQGKEGSADGSWHSGEEGAADRGPSLMQHQAHSSGGRPTAAQLFLAGKFPPRSFLPVVIAPAAGAAAGAQQQGAV